MRCLDKHGERKPMFRFISVKKNHAEPQRRRVLISELRGSAALREICLKRE